MCHHKVSTLTLSGIFDEKVGPFSQFLLPNGGLQNMILRAVLGKMDSIFKKFSKNCGFLVQGRSKKSIKSSFGLSFFLSK